MPPAGRPRRCPTTCRARRPFGQRWAASRGGSGRPLPPIPPSSRMANPLQAGPGEPAGPGRAPRGHGAPVRPVGLGPSLAQFDVECSAGTYVRSLAHDLGRELGCGAHLASLRRTASGPFGLSDARTMDVIEDLARSGSRTGSSFPWRAFSRKLPALVLGPEGVERARHGNRIVPGHLLPPAEGKAEAFPAEGSVVRLFGGDGRLLALARRPPGGTRYRRSSSLRIDPRRGGPPPSSACQFN